jgi:hypothetical protein
VTLSGMETLWRWAVRLGLVNGVERWKARRYAVIDLRDRERITRPR